jgi:hypothetical protein
MSMAGIVKTLLGLFVDDGSLALALIAWVAVSAFGLPWLPMPASWAGPLLFAGCLVVLVSTMVRGVRGKSKGRGK